VISFVIAAGIVFLVLFVIWSNKTPVNLSVKIIFALMTAWALWLFLRAIT
jgi:hypothetical protein